MTSREAEVQLGREAQQAYDIYVKNFVEHLRDQLYGEFLDASAEDAVKLQAIKRAMDAFDALETAILQDIETGRLAALSLTESEK